MRGVLQRIGGKPEARSPLESVLAHLRVLLNTRQGTWAARPDYGLPDFTDDLHNFPQGGRNLRAAVVLAIETFEPRLTHVQANLLGFDHHSASVQLEIHAQLTHRNVRFSTHVTRSHIDIQ